jgi:hypothetical protein
MQKISSYLYPNRILVEADLAASLVEWKNVYQRPIKIYQGLDNVLEFDFRNSDQKRQDISTYALTIVIMDQLSQEIYSSSLDVDTGIDGIAKLVLPASAIAYITPQFLKYTIYKTNQDGTRIPVYTDTYFSVGGTLEVAGGAMPQALPPIVIDTFIYLENDADPDNVITEYFSEAVEINPQNDLNEAHQISLEFRPLSLSADVTVQITNDVVVSSETNWRDLEEFSIAESTDNVTKHYHEITDYSNNVGWLRIKYVRADENTGTFDKILVRV